MNSAVVLGPVVLCAVLCQVFSRHATSMSLCLLRQDGGKYLEIMLDPTTNKTGDVWHIQLSKLKVGYNWINGAWWWYVASTGVRHLGATTLDMHGLR